MGGAVILDDVYLVLAWEIVAVVSERVLVMINVNGAVTFLILDGDRCAE